MNDSQFIKEINQIFQNTQDLIEKKFEKYCESEHQEGILNIFFKNEEYVINRNIIQKQIWVSSPFSGTHYFNYNKKNKKWTKTKNIKIEFQSFLIEDIKNNIQKNEKKN